MRQAIALAKDRVGLTGENPAVGCLIVIRGEVLAAAATAPGGRPHAEEQALAQINAAGATAYVTLEPCGERSSGALSCAQRLVDAGISQVFIAARDASLFAAGRGENLLTQAGVRVFTGLLADEAAPLYANYRHARKSGVERTG